MAYVDWNIQGPEYSNSNSNCNCNTRLDGLAWVGTFAWPGPIHLGGGTAQVFIDERADADQRKALLDILGGKETEPGATIFQVLSTTMAKVLDPQFVPIEIDIDVDACRARVAVPGVIDSSGTPIKSPFTGQDHRVRVTLRDGFEYTEAEYGSGTTRATGGVPLDFKDSYGHFAHIHLTQHGIPKRP